MAIPLTCSLRLTLTTQLTVAFASSSSLICFVVLIRLKSGSREELACANGRWVSKNVLATVQILPQKCLRTGNWLLLLLNFLFFFLGKILISIFMFPLQIRTFFKLKQKHANLYEDLYPISVKHVFEQELVKLIPVRDRNGSRILWIECGRM